MRHAGKYNNINLSIGLHTPDGNLEYAYMADGRMGFVDYTYLTYNDLYNVQFLIEQIYGARNADLDKLMKSKQTWMDANGIKGYLK